MISELKSENKAKISGIFPIIAALIGNSIVCIAKFIGFFITGSGSLFSEAIHSLADTANQFLLVIGIRQSAKGPDEKFNYGHGKERYIWALISACGIFFIGCGVTVYHGISLLIDHQKIHFSSWALIILVVSFLIEFTTFLIAVREIRGHIIRKSKHGFKKALAEADPSLLAVLYEDGLAVIGIIIALIGIGLTYLTGKVFFDAAASIIIGLMLGVMAIFLIAKNRNYLITKSIPKDIEDIVMDIFYNDPTIEKVLDFKSAILDVDKYLIKCDVEFNASALMREMSQHHFFENEYEEARESYENFMRFSVSYLDRVPRLVGKKIDDIEKKIRSAVPQAVFIDIEIN
ncbi:MAG: cation diffusion facilitator family transporter [Patescibacteria group bacterium]